MDRLKIILTCSVSLVFLLAGCSAQDEVTVQPVKEKSSAPMVKEKSPAPKVAEANRAKEVLIVRAKYFLSKQCIKTDGAFADVAIDAFEVVAVVKGDYKVKSITVRHSFPGAGYPKELIVGREYTLRLTPSERTKQQLKANDPHLVVDGDEIEEQNVS